MMHGAGQAVQARPAGLQLRPMQRLRVQAVLAVNGQLVRAMRDRGAARAPLRELMSERRRLLRELRTGLQEPSELGCFEAMQAAVEESDRALLRMLEDDPPCTTA